MRAEPALHLDVRPDVARHEDPFVKIMRAARALQPGQVLTVVNSFQPRLLYKALTEQGFVYEARRVEDKAWLIHITPRQGDASP